MKKKENDNGKVKRKSDKKKKERELKKKKGAIIKEEDELHIFEDLEIRQMEEGQKREELYDKKLELIKSLYYRTK